MDQWPDAACQWRPDLNLLNPRHISRWGLAALEPEDADAGEVAQAIIDVVRMPFGSRPFRRIGLEDLLKPAM